MQIPNTDSGCLNPKVGPIVRILGDPGGLGAWKNRLAKWARTQGTGSGRGSGSGIFSRGPAAGVAHSPVPMPAQSAQLPTVHNCGFLQKEPMLDDSIGLAKANSMPFHAPWAGLVGKGGGGNVMNAVASELPPPPAPQPWHPLRGFRQLCGSCITPNTQCCFLQALMPSRVLLPKAPLNKSAHK